MGGGVELPRGIDTSRVEALPGGDETSGVNPEGDGVPGAGGRGRAEDGNSPTTRDTEAIRDSSRGKEMASGPCLAAMQCPQQGTAEGGGSKVSMHRHPKGADGARPDHGAIARYK